MTKEEFWKMIGFGLDCMFCPAEDQCPGTLDVDCGETLQRHYQKLQKEEKK
jgi:hypothetical protein